MKFTIINNQPVKRMLPMIGSHAIEPYGILVFNQSESFKKSFQNLSAYGYSVYCEDDSLSSVESEGIKVDSTILTPDIDSEGLFNPKHSEVQDNIFKEEKTNEVISEIKKEIPEEIKEVQDIDSEGLSKLEVSPKEDIEEKKETSIEETREIILNKCKLLPADVLRAILREIGITSTSNNTNTLFNKLANSDSTDEILISAYHKVVDKDVED